MNTKTLAKHLLKREYASQTIEQIERSIDQYLDWLDTKYLLPEEATKRTALQYIEYAQSTLKYQPFTINQKLSHLRMFYQFLGTDKNPFTHLNIRGQRERIFPIHHSSDELQTIYLNISETTTELCRAKMFAGFYVFQGLATRDAISLLVESVDLERAELKIPRSRRANERTLPLHPLQMKLLFSCFEKMKAKPESSLYQAIGMAKDHRWVIKHMRILLSTSKHYISLSHIRYSVIRNWHKTNNLRQVQYNAGHRYVSTTEKLLKSDYEELRIAVLDKHPLG